MNCPKCKVKMVISKALVSEQYNDYSFSIFAKGKLVKCWKCLECGYSEEYNDTGWKRVIDELPEIPKGQYGIQVLVAEFDTCYDECSSKPYNGYSVHQMSYGYVNYEKMPDFKGSRVADGEATFMEMYIGGGDTSWGFPGDQVTHWMYFPVAPKYDPEVLNPLFQWMYDHGRPQTKLIQIDQNGEYLGGRPVND